MIRFASLGVGLRSVSFAIGLALLIAAPSAVVARRAAPGAPTTTGPETECLPNECGAFGTFANRTVQGTVLAELRPADTTRLSIVVKWEGPDFDTLKLQQSTAACGTPHTVATKLPGRIEFPNLKFDTEVVDFATAHYAQLESFRIFEPTTGGKQLACAQARVYQKIEGTRQAAAGPPEAEGAVARFNQTAVKGLVLLRLARTYGQGRVSVALTGLPAAGWYTTYGSEAPCGQPHLQGDLQFVTRSFTASKNEIAIETLEIVHDPAGLRSVRIARGRDPGGAPVACVSGYFIEIGGTDVWID